MTFSLLYPFQILCVLFLPISAFFLLKLLCLFPESVSLACLASSSSPPSPFSSRVATFWSNLHGNACYVGYLSSSSCIAGGVFVTKPLFSQSVSSPFSRRQSKLLFYSKTFLARTIPPSTQATLAGSLSLFLSNSSLIPPASFCPLLFFRFAFASQVLLFLRIQLTPTRIPNKSPLGCPV